MAVLTQGTQLYVLAPDNSNGFEVLEVGCPTAFNPGDETADDIDVTCLNERDVRQQMAGLTTPGEATLSINTDPSNASHVRLYEIKANKEVLKWAVGWSDGKSDPDVDSSGEDFDLPDDRTWLVFEGTLATFPFNFETNSVVQSDMTIKRSGAMQWVTKQ